MLVGRASVDPDKTPFAESKEKKKSYPKKRKSPTPNHTDKRKLFARFPFDVSKKRQANAER